MKSLIDGEVGILKRIVTTSAAAANLDIAAIPRIGSWELKPSSDAAFDFRGDVAVGDVVLYGCVCGSDKPGRGFGDVGQVGEGVA